MKTVKKKARVRFEEREGREGYKIEINLGDGWEFESWFPLVRKEGGENTDFIHWSILSKFGQMQSWGYEIDLQI